MSDIKVQVSLPQLADDYEAHAQLCAARREYALAGLLEQGARVFRLIAAEMAAKAKAQEQASEAAAPPA